MVTQGSDRMEWDERPSGREFLARLRPRNRTICIMTFPAFLFILYFLYGFNVGKPLPYSKQPRNPLIVQLPGYGTFRGTQVLTHLRTKVALDEPVDAWLGIEFSKQPVENLRFAPPDWPEEFEGTKDANEYGPGCMQGQNAGSEACLNINVYRTAGIPYTKKLPVMVFLHGGAFVMGNGRSFDGAAFVARSIEPIMVVTAQYRLGVLGSLPSALFEEEGLLNLGIMDQHFMLKFLQKYVSDFGGDREGITLAGQSAGGHSVGVLLFHNYGDDKDKPLFARAIISSGSSTARAFHPATAPIHQRQFQEFMDYIDCPTFPNAKALKCLRAADVQNIQYKSSQIYDASVYNITWPWQPVSPGPLLEKRGSTSGEEGTFFEVPILISSTTDEGKLFAPKDLVTTSHFTNFLENVNDGLTKEDLEDLQILYPDPDDTSSPYANSPLSKQFNRIAAAYGDYSYICPVQELAYRLSSVGMPVYKARFNTPNGAPEWQGIPHASDAGYFNGLPNTQFPEISELYSSYWASFVVSGDPNTFAIEGAPEWEVYDGVGGGVLAVGSRNGTGTGMESEEVGIRMEQCAWWRDEERMKRLDK